MRSISPEGIPPHSRVISRARNNWRPSLRTTISPVPSHHPSDYHNRTQIALTDGLHPSWDATAATHGLRRSLSTPTQNSSLHIHPPLPLLPRTPLLNPQHPQHPQQQQPHNRSLSSTPPLMRLRMITQSRERKIPILRTTTTTPQLFTPPHYVPLPTFSHSCNICTNRLNSRTKQQQPPLTNIPLPQLGRIPTSAVTIAR